ncbi:prophage tail fiber N-terminal domain-containing protein [Escherichia coli]|nr:prophage tail fiber N-terminal domain-containing protein [Escherichia coli]
MAAVKISGVLKDGAGKPIQNCTIQLKAKRNSTTVLVNTVASENPDEAGRYSMDVEYGQYSVTLLVEGFPPSHAGTITVYEGSRPGTLNDFLGAMTEDDVMPEALRRFEEMVEEAARNAEAASQSAAAAKKSETAAASSKNAAKTSETNAANSAQAAATSQTASANSATAAKKSETNAKNSETAAKTSETNAKSSQTAAKTSETNAKASETAAKNSQVAAAQSESAAAGSATSAAGSATAAANSQKAAKTSETNAKSSQTAAKTSETNAKASETAAKSSQDAAAQSESAAASSASAAAASATASANSQKAAKTSETNAKVSETAAANSAKASAASQTAAKASEDAAREYASQAAEPYKYVLQPLPIQAIDGELKIGSQIQYSPKQSGATVSGDYIYLATPQVEDGPCVSSFIISGATAATRASDIVTVPIKNNLYNLPFTVLCEVHKNWYKTPNAAPRVFDTGGHQTGAAIILGFGRSTDYDGFPYCDIGGANRRVNENASLEKMVMGMRVKSEQSTCSVSNGHISSETKTTWSCIQNTAIIRIGGQTTAGLRHLFGHVRNFRIWHKALTDAQVGESI